MDALVEELLTKDVYIVDYLPRTVPQNSGGQYFDVEYYLLNSPRYTALKDKFSSVIFKLMCYYRVCIPWDGGWVDQPNPELIDHIIAEIMDCHSGTLTCLEFLAPDELLEVTPENLRIRKRILDHDLRMKATSKKNKG